MNYRVVIPARFGSSRLPGKPLADVAGRPLILRVCDRARRSSAAEVIVATDDRRIVEVCRDAGVGVCMTAADHATGTDRIAEVAADRRWDEDDIVVNLQGDEPLMPASALDQVASLLAGRPEAELATLVSPIHSLAEFLDTNVVKVITDRSGRALYFSRAPIPWSRAGASGGLGSQEQFGGALRHVGLYAYRVQALRRLADEPACELETTEQLEQLRALWLGMPIVVDVARELPGPSVDNPEDLRRVSDLLSA